VIIAEAPSGKIVASNEQEERIWGQGFPPSENIGQYVQYPAFHADGRPVLPDEWPLARTITTGEIVENEEIRFKRGDGSFGWMITNSAPIRDAGGKIMAGVVVFQDVTERKEMEEALHRLNEKLEQQVVDRTRRIRQQADQLRALSARLAELQEVERETLSRELHDRIGQNLSALDFNLNYVRGQLSPSSSRAVDDRLVDSLSLVAQTADRIRDLMTDLRPPMLDQDGLTDSLEWYAQQFSSRSGLDIRVEDKTKRHRLSPAAEIGLFRIAQEALTNAAKHAQATAVWISLDRIGDDYRLTITDDGAGFDQAELAELPSDQLRLGLLTMRERAEVIGGRLRLESEPGQGTTIIVEVPSQ
jgi:PAS domain S-box-containing protein